MPKAKPKSKDRSRTAGNLLLIGLLFYCVSWFTPAYRNFCAFEPTQVLWATSIGNLPESAMQAAMQGPEWLPGWTACHVAFRMLVDEPLQPDGNQDRRRLAGASCLSNLGMLAALLLLAIRSAPRVLGVLLIALTAWNASWLYLIDDNPFAFLRAGYFLWLLSFPLTGLGLLLRPVKHK